MKVVVRSFPDQDKIDNLIKQEQGIGSGYGTYVPTLVAAILNVMTYGDCRCLTGVLHELRSSKWVQGGFLITPTASSSINQPYPLQKLENLNIS